MRYFMYAAVLSAILNVSISQAGFVMDANPEAVFRSHSEEYALSWHLESQYVYFSDVGEEIHFCDDEKLLLCISDPIPIFLPKKTSITSVVIGNNKFNLNIIGYKEQKIYEDICNNRAFWLSIQNNHSKYEYLLYFHESAGIKAIIIMVDGTSNDKFPKDVYLLKSGTLFPLNQVCKLR